jgi:adenylylsulfate kinase
MASKPGFVVWITGIPSSGKTSTAQALAKRLSQEGVMVEVLESDALRGRLTPSPRYTPEERALFYRAIVVLAETLARNGVNVIIDATANRRCFRDEARRRIPNFSEVYVKCPLQVAAKRDSKGLYRRAGQGMISTLPGLQEEYEPPLNPEVTVESDRLTPEESANLIIKLIGDRLLR